MSIFDTLKKTIEETADTIAKLKKQNPESNVIETVWDGFMKPVEGGDPAVAKVKSFLNNIVENMGNSINNLIEEERNHYCTKQNSEAAKQDCSYHPQEENIAPNAPHQDENLPTDYTH